MMAARPNINMKLSVKAKNQGRDETGIKGNLKARA